VTRYVGLLRAINVGKRQVPMAELKRIAEDVGLTNVRTYVASGNVVFDSDKPAREIEAAIEAALEARFGFVVETLVRSATDWAAYLKGNPMPDESDATPNFVMISVGREAATDALVEALRAKASDNERVERVDDVVWLYFANGAGRSKLTGGPPKTIWTTRNWRTVQKLAEMLRADA
jgi:uncharacterized protein (DUF1697 family)